MRILFGDIFDIEDTEDGKTKFIMKNFYLFRLVKDAGGFKKGAHWS